MHGHFYRHSRGLRRHTSRNLHSHPGESAIYRGLRHQPVFKREFDYALSFNNKAHVPPSQCQYFVLQFQMNILINNNRFFLEKLTFFESVVFVRLSISICTTAVDDVAFFDDNYTTPQGTLSIVNATTNS